MVGKKFLAIIKSVKHNDCISIVEILKVDEELYFDEEAFFKEIEKGGNSPSPMINNQSKFLSFLVSDKDNDNAILRINEFDLLFDVSEIPTEKVNKLKKQSLKRISEELKLMKEADSDVEVLIEDIDTHLHNLNSLGYTKSEIMERLQEFVDEKYPNFHLKINLKNDKDE